MPNPGSEKAMPAGKTLKSVPIDILNNQKTKIAEARVHLQPSWSARTLHKERSCVSAELST